MLVFTALFLLNFLIFAVFGSLDFRAQNLAIRMKAFLA